LLTNSVEYLLLSARTAAPKTKFCDVFAVVMPTFFTAAGRRPCAVLTRFWMSTVARSGSRFRSNVAVMVLDPLFPLVELMYFIPSAPLICCSRGMVTALSTVCALAPV
jgi:hypothetical protein